jgi:hypothetical protein
MASEKSVTGNVDDLARRGKTVAVEAPYGRRNA